LFKGNKADPKAWYIEYHLGLVGRE
jgi:hypothetical protein